MHTRTHAKIVTRFVDTKEKLLLQSHLNPDTVKKIGEEETVLIRPKRIEVSSSPPIFRVSPVMVLFLSLFLTATPVVSAANLTGDSNTYVQSRETADKAKILGAYEYLDLAVSDLGSESVSFHTGGWLRYDLKTDEFGRKSDNDVQYSYLSFKSKTDNTVVNLGRVMVFEGVAAERIDGAYARTDLKGNIGVSAFAGVPVETTALDLPGNNLEYGGRVSQQVPGLYRIGLSAIKEVKDGNDFRKEEGIDLWLSPVSKVELFGRSNYNADTKKWMENTYYLALGPISKVRLNTQASWISYGDFFTGATTSVFSFQPGIIDQKEKVRILGEEAVISVTDKLALSLDYKGYTYDIAGDAKYYGGNVRYTGSPSYGSGISVHTMQGDVDRLKYAEYRLYSYHKMGKADIAFDILDVKYKEAINGVKDAYSFTVAAQYALTEKLKVGADAEYSKNPDFDKDIRVFFKANYRFDLGKQGGA